MTAQRPLKLLADLDRLALTVPNGAHRVIGSAVFNARKSLDEISRAVQDRRALRHELDYPASPGDLAVLSTEECRSLLASRSVGRMAYIARAGVPDIVPVNYSLEADAILVRTGCGPKLQAAERRELVAFEVDDIDESTHTGWSVVVVGRATRLATQHIGVMAGPTPWANGPRLHRISVETRRITGRRLL